AHAGGRSAILCGGDRSPRQHRQGREIRHGGLQERAQAEGQWGGNPPPPEKYVDLSYYNRAVSGIQLGTESINILVAKTSSRAPFAIAVLFAVHKRWLETKFQFTTYEKRGLRTGVGL